jgi:hypothetical protein
MHHHHEAEPTVGMAFKLNLADRRLLLEYSRRNDMTMADVVRLGIRKICAGVDKPEQSSAA